MRFSIDVCHRARALWRDSKTPFRFRSLPVFSLEKIQAVWPDGIAIALRSHRVVISCVADGMTGRRHRSNCELSAQGVANIFDSVWRYPCYRHGGTNGHQCAGRSTRTCLAFFTAVISSSSPDRSAASGLRTRLPPWVPCSLLLPEYGGKEEFWSLSVRRAGTRRVGYLPAEYRSHHRHCGPVVLGALRFLHQMAESVEVADGDPRSQTWPTMSTRASGTMPAGHQSRRHGLSAISGAFSSVLCASPGVLDRVGAPRLLVLISRTSR